MGGQNSKIDTLKIPISQIRANSPVEQGRFCPPFRKFKNQKIQINDRSLLATVTVEEPSSEQISINEKYFQDLEDAFDSKTKQLELISVLNDDQYIDMKTYLAKEKDKQITIQLKPFNNVNSYNFNNILYEIHMNEEIAKLNSINLNTIQDKYIIQTGLQVEGEQNPNTQVYILAPVTTNLSEIIRYRRQNNWPWSTNQFNALASDLCNALSILHNANISHNDIRPCNVFYSLQKNCYQLGCFANAVRVQDKNVAVSQMRTSAYYGAPELSTSKQANFQQADIYSLGMTLLSAFYLCQPVDRKAVTDYNKKFESSYSVMGTIRQMVMPIDKRSNISVISARIPKGQPSQTMKHLISSLQYKNAPKDGRLIASKKQLSEAYQRLGLWNDWKNQHYEAYELQENTLDDYRKANSLIQLSKIQSCRGELQSACQYAKSASKIFRGLGYNSYEQGNINQSINLFTHATECSKYFQNRFDIETAKNLQGLALAHCQKGDYELCKPLIRESTQIVVKNTGRDSIDYCKVLISEAKIQSEFGQFQNSQKILNQCLNIAESKIKINEQLGLKLKAQVLHEMGKNSLKWSQHSPPDKRPALIAKAEKNLADSIMINEQFPQNHLVLANNIDAFGQIDLTKQNFNEAKVNFKKSQQLRDTFIREHQNAPTLHKQAADTLCNIGACESGLGNHAEAIRNCNQALEIYRRLYGSDHNKFSAMAIGNMSKIYYKMNNKGKAKQCLGIATQILRDQLGQDDPDYEYFKQLESTL